ncbi:Inactive serine/threonine-protein kinase TEX14, partial [Melipona quadrifasciata]
LSCWQSAQKKKDKQGYAEPCQDEGGGATVRRLKRLRGNRGQAADSWSVRRKCRNGTSFRQSAVSCEKQGEQCNSRANFSAFLFATFTCQFFGLYFRTIARCATCALGMMGMFKWLKKDAVQRDRNGRNITQKQSGLNNESYRNALQAFIDRRRTSDDIDIEAPCSPDKKRTDKIFLAKNNKNKCDNERKLLESKSVISGLPHVPASQIFEIGWVAGTEDRYLELIFAEWQNTRVSLKRHSHPECKNAMKTDLDILSEIRHPNVLLLMASTFTDEHGVISIFESIDCTLYHYIHDQGERIPIQGIAKCGGRLSDALRHSHMRGYVHTAISSHCVYLTSNGVVKLGGWELAMHINGPKPEREYEERLRSEIFRWQAPELFRSYEPYTETDVYGLALLIWEMCTMHVPWNGYSKVDVERQYVHWKRGVTIDLYDFPLLHNLLDAGLQLDVNKRTLDMNKMRRFLQKLEIQYENEEPIYIDEYMNNNNKIENTYILQTKKSPTLKNKSSKLTKSVSTMQLSQFPISPDTSSRHFYSKKSISKQNINQKNEESNAQQNSQPWNNTYKKVKAPQETTESRTTSVYSSPLLESTDDESFKDARTNLKQLKKILADKREHFFYGSDSSTDISPTSKLFIETRSKDYEPHKPASHKTSLEPKFSKSPTPYDPTYLKSTFRKTAYLHAPEGIKNAIMQPRVLNSDPQSFFETSLWRKEKLICLSKMRKTCTDESIDNSESATYAEETNQEGCTQVLENTKSTTPTSRQGESLQTLKDALDRATKIVRSISPNSNDSCPSPSFKCSYQDFEITMDDNQDKKQLFENLYDLQVDDDDEIKIIERSVTKDETFWFDKPNPYNKVANDETQESSNNILENYSHSYNASSRNFICESIAEVSGELNISHNDAKETKTSNNEVNATTSEAAQNSETSAATLKQKLRRMNGSLLARRRSLPATLSQLKIGSNPNLGKLPIRRGDVRENTVEDLYIDDEFGDSLNINMVLLHQDLIDEDFLSDISDL